MIIKNISIITIFIIVFINTKELHLDLTLNPYTKYLSLYQHSSPKSINFRWNFTSSQIILDESLKHKRLYFDEQRKIQLSSQNFKINYTRINHELNDDQDNQYLGTIGMAQPNSQFMIGLKRIFDVSQMKYWFKLSDNIVQVIPLKCFKPIFKPYEIQVATWSSVKYKIDTPSFNFEPGETFLALINKTANPFPMSSQELTQVLSLKFMNETKAIRKKQIMKSCSQFTTQSEQNKKQNPRIKKFQCELQMNDNPKNPAQNGDVGKLLMNFQPVICSGNGIELQPTTGTHEQGSGYYWLHLLLLCTQVGVVLFYFWKDSLLKQNSTLMERQRLSKISH